MLGQALGSVAAFEAIHLFPAVAELGQLDGLAHVFGAQGHPLGDVTCQVRDDMMLEIRDDEQELAWRQKRRFRLKSVLFGSQLSDRALRASSTL